MTKVEEQARPPRWFQRVVPMTALVLGAVVVAALVSPAFRQEVELSTTKQEEPFVELYFASPADGGSACRPENGKARVKFGVTSHLTDPQELAYEVAVNGEQAQRGSVEATPLEKQPVAETVAVPDSGAYGITVTLPEQDQRIHLTCGEDDS